MTQPTHDLAGERLEALQRDLAAAHAEIALIGQQMAGEVAARNAAQEEAARQLAVAAEAHTKRRAALEAEVDQLRERLDEIAPLPDAAPTGRWGRLRRFAARPAAGRTKFGSIAAAAVLGLALGAAGVAWWKPAGAPMPGESQVAQTSGERTSGPAAEVPATVAPPPASPVISAAILESRIQAAFAQQGLSLPVRVKEGLTDVSLDDEALDAGQRAKAVVIVRSAFAGAGLPDPGIEHAAPSRETASSASQRPPAAAVTRPGSLPSGLVSDASPPVDDRRNPEDERPVPAARSGGGHSRADAAALGRTVPQATSRSETARNANALKSLEASCQQQLSEPLWDPRRPWRLASCMKQACCRQGVLRNEECRAFNQRYPLNCS